jgi:hypothetical protein
MSTLKQFDWFGTAALVIIVAFVLWLLFAASNAFAATATLRWTNPTTNTDDTAIPVTGPGSLVSNRYEWGTCAAGGAFGVRVGEATLQPIGTTATVPNLEPGTWCFRVFARNTYNVESAASNVASLIVDAPTPNPPLLSTITVAYETWRFFGRTYLGRSVGTIQRGTPCGARIIGRNYYEVSPSLVTLTRIPRPGPLVTRCAAG